MSKFTNVFSVALSIILAQIVIAAVSIVFLPVLSFLTASDIGIKVYSSVTALMFLYSLYSTVWNAGRKDAKHVKVFNKHNEKQICISYKKSVVIGLIASMPSVIALAALIISAFTGNFDFVNIIYRLFQSSFLGWLGNDNLTYIPNCVIITIIPILLSIPAYYAGTKDFSVLDKYMPKIIYKSPEKKNKK